MGCASSTQLEVLDGKVAAVQAAVKALETDVTKKIAILNDKLEEVEIVEVEEESVTSENFEPPPDKRIHFLNFSW
jgi:hypothetical protein